MIEAVQYGQDAQAGYACDYQNKRGARGCNEVKESIKGHRTLHDSICTKRPEYIGKRHVTRLMSDAYGKGVVRSNPESINLRVYAKEHDVTSAECFHTAQTIVFPGRDVTAWREAIHANSDYVKMLQCVAVDRRNPFKRTLVAKNLVYLYGHRSQDTRIWLLSLYEFIMN